jgi:threonine dehydratase
VLLHGANFDAAQANASGLALESGRTLVHPFDDLAVIAGQGTMGLEMIEAVPDLDIVVLPVGGGGLLAGVATVVKACRPAVRVIAVQTENTCAFSAARANGGPAEVSTGRTLADGLAVARVGEIAFAISSRFVDQVVTVSESEIAGAISLLARNGIVAEGAGASALAAVLGGEVRGGMAVVPVSGGNIDPRVHERAVIDGAAPRRRASRAA